MCVCVCVSVCVLGELPTSLVSVIEKQVGKKPVFYSEFMVTERLPENLQSSSSAAQTVCMAERKMQEVVEKVNACSEVNRYCQGAACTKCYTCLAVTVSSNRNGQ